jgi:hypothetical protein
VPALVYAVRGVPGVTRPVGRLDVEWAELVSAAVTVGKWRDDLFSRGIYSLYEGAYRANLVWAFVRDEAGRFVRTDAYNDLDPTEKGHVSYHLGMITAKILAERLLRVPWLMHIDRYRTSYGVALAPGPSRPDLFGPRDVNRMRDWVVLEAKGRTNALRKADVAAMRAQKHRVVTVGGRIPWIRGGVAAHFTRGALEALFVDPRPRRNERREEAFTDYEESSQIFFRAYYEPIIALAEDESRTRIPDLPVAQARLVPEMDAVVGLTAEALSALSTGRMRRTRAARPSRSPQLTVGRDGVGILLGTSWAPEAMALDPRERPSQRSEPTTFER